MIRTFRDVALKDLHAPFVEFDPEYFIKWDSPSNDPVPGYVFARNPNTPPIRAFFIPPKFRLDDDAPNASYGVHIPMGVQKPVTIKQQGTNQPIRAMKVKSVFTRPWPKTVDSYLEFQHVMLERPLPDTVDPNAQFRFVPEYVVSGTVPNRGTKLEDLPKNLTYAVAVPVDKGENVWPWLGSLGLRIAELFRNPSERVVVPRGVAGVEARIKEETRIRGLYKTREGLEPGPWNVREVTHQSAQTFGLELPFALTIQAVSAAITVLTTHRFLTEMFG